MALRDLNGSVDFAYLEDYLAQDVVLIDEILALFQQQCDIWSPFLTANHEGVRDAAHTLKGSALGIGAKHLGALAERIETGDEQSLPTAIERLKDEMNKVLVDVAAYRHALALRDLKS